MEGEKSGENHDFHPGGHWRGLWKSTGLSAETQMVLDGLGAWYCKWSFMVCIYGIIIVVL